MLDDDRRRVVNAGVRHGRDALIANMRATAEVGVESMTTKVVATRGERLALNGVRSSRRGEVSDEVLIIAEIDADNRIAAGVVFDADDIDAAFAELDARYLAGEAAAHSHTWSVIKEAYAGFNRRESPPTTPNWVNIDHRRAVARRARRNDRIYPCHVGFHARREPLHRGSASAEQPRSSRDPRVERDLTAGLRRRVAGDRTS